jgi:hypothetical protein
MVKVTLNLIATNGYTVYLNDIIESAKDYFMRDTELSFIIYTNSINILESDRIKVVNIENEPWPGPTLKRFHYFCKAWDIIEKSDFSFYIDVDSSFRKSFDLSDLLEILPKEGIGMIGTLHPGYYGTKGTPERRINSTAYIPHERNNRYFCGGFFGGRSSDFLNISRILRNNIDIDLGNGIVAIWHDESHINNYFLEYPPSIVLGEGFSCPEEHLGGHGFSDPTILFLNKGEKKNELRKIFNPEDLSDCTFIIPVMIEHEDRYNNAKSVLSYLNKNFKTHVFIYEISEEGSKLDFIPMFENLKITHWLNKPESAFHRTKYLNIMLDNVTTKVVVNYDIDVLLKPNFYKECVSRITEGESDVIYPYKFGSMGQRRIERLSNTHSEFALSGYDLKSIDKAGNLYSDYDSEYGHCIFFNTEIYKKYGAENENFISYGPEDKERGERFKKMGFNVNWVPESMIYHFEHYRGLDSSNNNPYITPNWDVYNKCSSMDGDQLITYYKNQEYNKKYKTIG